MYPGGLRDPLLDVKPLRHPERRAGQARRPRAGGEHEVTAGLAWTVAVAAASVAFVAGTGRAMGPDLDLQAVQEVCGRCHTPALFLN